jgi:hypothetical protein
VAQDDDSFAPVDGYLLEEQEQFIEIPTPEFETTYKYIKNLIFDGFVPFHIQFFGIKLIMKGLNPDEYRFIEMIELEPIRRVPLYFLYSIVLVDGDSILPYRADLHEDFIKFWLSLPTKVCERAINIVQAIQNAQSDCYENLEGYLYETESRYIWGVHGKRAIKNKLIKGIELIGLNTAQESWVMFNTREDLKEEQDRQFDHSKFIVSGMVGGKEIKKIETSENLRQKEERQRRQDVRLKNKKDKIMLGPSLNTADDLVKELERQIRGEKDIHDQIVDQHEKKLREFMDLRRSEMEQLATIRDEVQKGEGSKSVSPEEMQKVLEEVSDPIDIIMQADHYTSKIEQTSLSKQSKPEGFQPPKAKRIGDMKPSKSIFDPEVQKELEKLKSDS